MLLAIDTSTTVTGVACYHHHGLIGECAWYSGRNHTTQVLPQVQLFLAHLGYTPSDIEAVGVALGPGSWSGLRVGLSIAKGLAFAGGLGIIGVGTLDALAYQYSSVALPVYPLIRLGRERFATAMFQWDGNEWERKSKPRNVSLADLCAEISHVAFFCGDIDATVQAEIYEQLQGRACFPVNAAMLRRPGYLASLAWQRFIAGDYDEIARLEPLYLGEPVKAKA